MPARISRATYAQMFGPTVGDKVRLADTELFIEVEKDFTIYGEEVKFGGGKVIRDGMGQSQVTRARGRRRYRHHQRADRRPHRHLQGRCRPEGRPHRRHRQGRQSGHPARRHHHHRPLDRGDRRRGQDPHRRRHGRAYPLHLPAADRGSADVGHHHHARRRHRPGARHARHHLHRRLAHRAHDRELRRLPDEPRARRQGQRLAAGAARGDDPRRRLLAQAARGLGHDARRDRQLPLGRRRVRRAGDDPHRHAERVRLRRGHDRAPSRAAPSTPSTPKAPAAAMRPTSSRSRRIRTSSRPRPTRRGPTRSTRSPSISTC